MNNSQHSVVHAVIPAAGLATRFLPFSKAVPKELLPLGNRPCVDYVVSEAVNAGIDDVLLVTRPGKEAIVQYFDPDPALMESTEGTPAYAHLDNLHQRLQGVKIAEVDQGNPAGLGHAIAQAAGHVGNRPFAVLLPDDLIPEDEDLLSQMVAIREQFGGSVIAAIRVTPEQATSYGSIGFEPPTSEHAEDGKLLKVTKLVEKPALEDVLSEFAVAGRYVLDPAAFEVLKTLHPGRNGEIQLTDALAKLAEMDPKDGGGLHAVVYEGPRYDTGTPEGYLAASVRAALKDPATRSATEELVRSVHSNLS